MLLCVSACARMMRSPTAAHMSSTQGLPHWAVRRPSHVEHCGQSCTTGPLTIGLAPSCCHSRVAYLDARKCRSHPCANMVPGSGVMWLAEARQWGSMYVSLLNSARRRPQRGLVALSTGRVEACVFSRRPCSTTYRADEVSPLVFFTCGQTCMLAELRRRAALNND